VGKKAAYAVVNDINNSPFLDCVGDLIQLLVHLHARWVCVVAEAEAHDAGFFT
jgi:hypothetical protein